jgi:hypothetical protein
MGSNKVKSLKSGILTVSLSLLIVTALVGANVYLAFADSMNAIHTLASSRSYTATMLINGKAEDVWQSVVNVAKKRNPGNLKIKKENKKDLIFEASKITENGEELMALLKVKPVSKSSSELTFRATMGGGKPLEKAMHDMVIDILLGFCEEEGLTCKVVK